MESTSFWNPESAALQSGIQYPGSGIHSMESRIQDCPGFPYMGRTEREFLSNIETIVRNSLLHDKLKSYFADPESTKEALLNKVTFCNDRIKA